MYIQTSTNTQLDDNIGLKIAIEEAKKSLTENGVPKMSPIFHAEMATFDAAGHVSKAGYRHATLYTTLTPCDMSVGGGGHDILRGRGVEVVDMDSEECYEMLQKFMKDHPDRWKNPSKIACN
ncbi:uncharacterized protein LAJ45_00076 [Morchella importuna]|uniref:uncharacterized protein n=1 Tax=Morchella importuna TaxID=1174673 RepID=UPI001E8E1A2C|nr:uncharacterized protein LAJ45_00076 [Morchella importuna]KAH8155067.1 hypothetical protein LAJ45_00076 [Morchella importuna]